MALTACADADHAGCQDTRRKAEYIAMSGCCAQILCEITAYSTTELSPQIIRLCIHKIPMYCEIIVPLLLVQYVQHSGPSTLDLLTPFYKRASCESVVELCFVTTGFSARGHNSQALHESGSNFYSRNCMRVTKKRMPKSSLQFEEPAHTDEEADLQRALELSLKEQAKQTQGPAHPVVLREPDSGKYQPLPEVQGQGKEKVVDEQAAHTLLTLQTPTKKSHVDQFIFQRCPSMHTEPNGQADSPSLDAKLPLTDSETESNEEVPVINAGDQDEGQARPNPGEQDEGQARPNPGEQDGGQAGSNPGDAVESQPQPSHVVHVILEEPASSTGTLSSLQNLDKYLSFTDQFFVEKTQEEEPGKTNAEAEVQSMVSVPIHQDTSSVPLMTTPVINLTKSQSDSPLPTSTATTLTIITTTTLPPPPPSSSHWLYKLENLNIPHQVSKAVDEIVADAVDWAMQAPLRARFRDLPTVDMKEILQQWMFEDNTYKTHEPPLPPPPVGASDAPAEILRAQGLSPTDYLMQDDSILKERLHLSDDEDPKNDHQLKADSRKDWWKPLPEEERPATPEPA
ncbi:retrovirus-related pol polyprotein from transposon TNT 1-94 [Tanacetum coccineum]